KARFVVDLFWLTFLYRIFKACVTLLGSNLCHNQGRITSKTDNHIGLNNLRVRTNLHWKLGPLLNSSNKITFSLNASIRIDLDIVRCQETISLFPFTIE